MARDLTIMLENRPGILADVAEAAGRAGVNLAGGCGVVEGSEGTLHLLVEDDADAARAAVEAVGIEVADEREVLVIDVRDQPGTLGSYARKLADAGINIDLFYVATRTRLVVGVDDVEGAIAALA